MNSENETTLENVEESKKTPNPDDVVHYVCYQCQPIAFCGWDTSGEEPLDSYDDSDACAMCVMEAEKRTESGRYICRNGHLLKMK
ncbi:hypothetical protein QEH42_gp053 [Microbacterium phage Pumpernickel]|uniref:Uncharacterized protein n=1 Tax=Microbacterium phage Pumpernickel TaxID=2885983 RepID=A0AAE9C3E0_9CAUD|nr:hypothetical protein QEH42_gp053 [Microbacterium phage Pumpernickel]UDL15844.1 hypothetical protein SEA_PUMPERNICKEL_53 [Microbacterium phage Pumpernickel]